MEKFRALNAEHENQGKQERREKIRETLRAIVAVFMLTLPATTEAVELDSYDWLAGLQALKARTAMAEKEYAGLAVKINETDVHWINFKKGENYFMYEESEVGHSEFVVEETMQRVNIIQMASDKGLKELTVCRVHTHPHVSEAYGPSSSDLLNHMNFRIELNKMLSSHETLRIDVVGVAADERGIWYYSADQVNEVAYSTTYNQLESEPAKAQIENQLFEHGLIIRSDKAGEIEKKQADHDLGQLYKDWGFSVRFVPYADVAKEPPCAGPHYQAAE